MAVSPATQRENAQTSRSESLRQAGVACLSPSHKPTEITCDPGSPKSEQHDNSPMQSGFGKLRALAQKVLVQTNTIKHWRTEVVQVTPVIDKPLSSSKHAAAPSVENKPDKPLSSSKHAAAPSVENKPAPSGPREFLPEISGPVKGARRKSLPCLKVHTARDEDVSKRLQPRRVSFTEGQQELFEAFTPYCAKYGEHPADFDFDAEGKMLMIDNAEEPDLLECKEGDFLECIAQQHVEYYTRPQLSACDKSRKGIAPGKEIVVKKRCGEWVQDNIGWLPLLDSKKNNFAPVIPKAAPRFGVPRVSVMGLASKATNVSKAVGKS